MFRADFKNRRARAPCAGPHRRILASGTTSLIPADRFLCLPGGPCSGHGLAPGAVRHSMSPHMPMASAGPGRRTALTGLRSAGTPGVVQVHRSRLNVITVCRRGKQRILVAPRPAVRMIEFKGADNA